MAVQPVRRRSFWMSVVLRTVVAASLALLALGALPERRVEVRETAALRSERLAATLTTHRLPVDDSALARAARAEQPAAVRALRSSGEVVAPPSDGRIATSRPAGVAAAPDAPTDGSTEPPEVRAAEALGADRVLGGDASTDRFALIGLTMDRVPDGPVLVKVHDRLGWSDWYELPVDPGEGPDAGVEGPRSVGTAPLWTGDADGYVVSLPSASGDDAVQVATVRRQQESVVVDAPALERTSVTAPGIRPRSSWGARPPANPIDLAASVRFAVVHHTASSNSYSASDVPAILRSIQAFHIDGRGWSDIGYNFLVDKFGGMWEGRDQSLAGPAIGAHAAGFNTSSVGISNIGSYDAAQPTGAQLDATAEIAAWRLASYGVNPSSDVSVTAGAGSTKFPVGTAVVIPRVVGHRDVGSSDCPGGLLWATLPSLRLLVAQKAAAYGGPVGNVESWSTSPGRLRVSGWALDDDTDGPINVFVDAGPGGVFMFTADDRRDDVAAVTGAPQPFHGFDETLALPPGRFRVCLYGLNAGPGVDRVIGCNTVATGGPPLGNVERFDRVGGTVRVSGWAIDPDTPGPVLVLVDAGGNLAITRADGRRDDVAAANPFYGPDHGFSVSAPLAGGPRNVCVYALNQGPGADSSLGCRIVK